MAVSINLPGVTEYEWLEFSFELDDQTFTVPLAVEPGQLPSPDELGAVINQKEVELWAQAQVWYPGLVDQFCSSMMTHGIDAQIVERFGLQSTLTVLGMYQEQMDRLGDAMGNRVRFYRPELVNNEGPFDHTLMIDGNAVDAWVESLDKPKLGPPLVRGTVEQVVLSLVQWALEQRPSSEVDLLKLVVDGLNRYGDDLVERAAWQAVTQGAEVYRGQNITLDQLEKFLGLRVRLPDPSELVLPVGPGALGISEGLNAAVDNQWSVIDGLVSYQTPVDDLLVSLAVTEDGANPITVVERALKVVDQIDPLAARLHLYLTTVAEQQTRPWLDPFSVDTDDIIQRVNLGRLGRVRKSAQVAQVIRNLRSLSQVLVALEWIDDPDYEGSFTNLWTIDEYRVKRGRDPVNKLPYGYRIEIRPGHWARQCLGRNNLRAVHAPASVLTRRDNLALNLLRWYYQTPSTQFTVEAWLAGADALASQKLSDRFYRANLHRRFDQAVEDIKPDLNPAFDLVEADDWLEQVIIKRAAPIKPVTADHYVSELQRMRVEAKLTQADLGRLAGYSQPQVSKAERSPGSTTAKALQAVIENMNK
jgi:hypothetical protein